MWDPVLEELERSHEVLAIRLSGHVDGPRLAEATQVSVAALVDAVERDMDDAGFETAHVVGNSLGGWIALELARRGRARSVVALSPAGGWESGTRAERRLRVMFARNRKLSARFLSRLERWVRRPGLRRFLLAQVVAHGERLSPADAFQMIRDSLDCAVYFELMDAITRDGPPGSFEGVTCPVMLAWGTKDRILPLRRYSARLRKMLPHAEWVELRGLGHVPMSDEPELVARTISQFTARAAQQSPVPAY